MRIYNHLTHEKEEFVPLVPGKVMIYTCGPTVYDYFHIGNARPFILFDQLRRYFEYAGYEVKYVQNFTDIDDKMINRANAEGITVAQLADRFIAEYFKDADALHIRRADVHPRATEQIGQIIALIKRLIDNGYAYPVENGDVYFDTQAFPGYGKLSSQNLADLEAGARIAPGEIKRHPMDFALWKAEKPGEPSWKSPWGMGRPGWHIECSAMCMRYLGETIDIHCGGQDLLFPHHENEVAQSEGATGKPLARYWMHNGFININNEKMSKSKGNFFTIRDIAKECDLEAVRLFMLSSHYRNPINFSKELIEQSTAALNRLYTARDNLVHMQSNLPAGEAGEEIQKIVADAKKRFVDAMEDDFNTADAVGAIFELVRAINVTVTENSTAGDAKAALDGLNELCGVMGLVTRPAEIDDPEALKLLEERAAARQSRDYAKSDEIRDKLASMGYVVEDTKQGQKLRRA